MSSYLSDWQVVLEVGSLDTVYPPTSTFTSFACCLSASLCSCKHAWHGLLSSL